MGEQARRQDNSFFRVFYILLYFSLFFSANLSKNILQINMIPLFFLEIYHFFRKYAHENQFGGRGGGGGG
ncbi:MAG: hypothetical protein K2G29_07270, partial [Muribaculaceae bacterium]|nr:hypothetical protein [Muribaculaceae bacterium]